ncbi:MAG: site-2 protease family protein, partial [Candidatus Sumerlaeia bacterium]|nr:site-2 protease family protein [Candidatus Sumerlaeia bacterium]
MLGTLGWPAHRFPAIPANLPISLDTITFMTNVAPATELLTATLGMSLVTGFIIGMLGFIIAFGLAVFIHELGHFLAAKAFGVPVERFVIGFDKEAMPFLP